MDTDLSQVALAGTVSLGQVGLKMEHDTESAIITINGESLPDVKLFYFHNFSADKALPMSGLVLGSTRARWPTSRTQSSWMELAR